jgi:hypothetical protein
MAPFSLGLDRIIELCGAALKAKGLSLVILSWNFKNLQ